MTRKYNINAQLNTCKNTDFILIFHLTNLKKKNKSYVLSCLLVTIIVYYGIQMRAESGLRRGAWTRDVAGIQVKGVSR